MASDHPAATPATPGRQAVPVSATAALLGAAHPGPTVAVTVLTALLAVPAELGAGETGVLVAAVLAGQLSIGWSNDLVDAARDRQVGRTDKPLASGAVDLRTVRAACAAALVATVVLSLLLGPAAAVAQLALVASGWAYNLGVKTTALSWLPYAVGFGALPAAVWLSGDQAPPWWAVTAGALLGVGAHLLNALPDLADDEATGVRGLPHRLGPRWCPPAAVGVLAAGSLVVALGAPGLPTPLVAACLVLVTGLAALALVARGRAGLGAVVAIAVVDVLLLVVGGTIAS